MSKNKTVKNFGGMFNIIDNNLKHIATYSNGLKAYTVGPSTIKKIFITRVIYNNPATIVFWSDDTKTISKCKSPDVYSQEVGLLLCCMKKLVSAGEVKKLLRDWTNYEKSDDNIVVTAADVRKTYRDRGEFIVKERSNYATMNFTGNGKVTIEPYYYTTAITGSDSSSSSITSN